MANIKSSLRQIFFYFLFSFTPICFLHAAEDYQDWQYSTEISVNTSSLGLGGAVYNFPLLIRLDNTNFTFSQALSNGYDIRFSKQDGTHLFYERERWDNPNNLAEFWVLVDTVNASGTQSLKMYWGKSDAPDSSQAEQVFRTSAGNDFRGVWHFNQNFIDATSNNNDGTNNSTVDTTGNIGRCRYLEGDSDFLNHGNSTSLDMSGNDKVTISAWVRRDGANIDNEWEGIAGKFTWNGGNLREYAISNNNSASNGFSFHTSADGTGTTENVLASGFLPTNGTWYHVVAVASGSTKYIYVNGVQRNSISYTSGLAQTSANFEIGRLDDFGGSARQYWNGKIDEVRVANTDRSGDWIKLCYETQTGSQSVVTVVPLAAPVITTHPQSATILVGSSVTLTVAATGNPIPTYKWEKEIDGTWTDLNDNDSLHTISPVTLADSGNYRALATNSVATATSTTASLTISDSVRITAQPENDTADFGDAADFTVTTSGSGVTYQWQKKNGSWANISGANAATLNLSSVSFTDQAWYRVIASNSINSVTSDSVYLLVYDSVYITTQPENDTANFGDAAEFRVTTTGNAVTFQWQKSDGAWTNISGANAATLNLSSVSFTDQAWYRVIASNSTNTVTSDSAYLVVYDSVHITSQPENDTAVNGDAAEFRVTTTGNTVTFQWQKKNGAWTNISGATGAILNLSSVSFTDQAWYRVIASTSTNTVTSDSAYLLVYDPIVITAQPQNDTNLISATASFSLSTSGTGFTYQWQRNDGGWHAVASGGNDTVYSFSISSQDDGVFFRCLISSGPISGFSDSAKLTIATTPSITSSFSPDTAMAVGGNLNLTGSATGLPNPSYEWFFFSPASPTPVSKGIGATFYITNGVKADSGTYYFVATNKYGNATSDSIFIHVLSPVSITVDIPSSYNVIDGGIMMLRPQVSGDGLLNYQWYQNANPMSGENGDSLSFGPIDSAQHDGTSYYLQASNNLHGVTIGNTNTTTCTLHVSQFYNPFKIRVQRISMNNTSQVRVSLWSDVSLTGFPTTDPVFPPSPWADSLWVLYQTNSYASSENTASIARFSTQEIKQAAPNPVEHTLTVGNLPQPHDSCFWFNYSVKWHNPDTLLKPFIPAEKVFMVDTVGATNPLVVHGEYVMKTDTAKIHLDSIAKLDALRDSSVVVLASRFPGFDPLLLNDTLSISELTGSGNRHTIILDNIGSLPLETDTMYCRWFVLGKNLTLSNKLDTTVIIGWDRPVYTGILQADSTYMGDQIHLAWTAPPSGIDSIRIWWDLTPVPLIHNPNLPQTQAFYPHSTLILTDTLKNVLTNNTVYYVGLQIFKDDMWSRITAQASDTVKTALGNTDTIPNYIKIDSTGFNNLRNSVTIYWHIDLSLTPGGSYLQMGYTYEPGLLLDTANKPILWDSIGSSNNMTEIPLADIIFDSIYTVGLWLRTNHITMGPGRLALPTDSSRTSIATPPFTWQAITFFTDSIMYVANKKIILQKIAPFVHHDTLWAYPPGDLVPGFADVGGIPFRFGNKTPGIAPFLLGLTYESLAPGVSVSDLAMYQIIDNEYHVFHNSFVRDSAVWMTITNKDMAYPFIVLADTLQPQLIVALYNDTITKSSTEPIRFNVRDNCANCFWHFTYGAGNTGYTHSFNNYLSHGFDTTYISRTMDTNIINEAFGVRALITASDGIHSDTINISRCVKNLKGETFSIIGHEWSPIRTTKGLNETSLEKILDRSITSDKPWAYDTKAFRIFRWHALSARAANTWIEYNDTIKDEFHLHPGQPVWCKVSESHALSIGSGVTTTLKEPFQIKLKPKNYTDITSPFQFPIHLYDVLIASAPYYDSLDVYYWRKDGTSYTADILYLHSLDTITNVTDTLISHQKYDAYTIYNHHSQEVTLSIPPVSLPLTRYQPSDPILQRERNVHTWDIRFRWKNIASSGETFFKTIRCGYKQSASGSVYGVLPPTMNKLQAGVYDASKEKISGWALTNNYAENGGMTFEIIFTNGTSERAEIVYYIDNFQELPENFQARIYNPSQGKYEYCTEDKIAKLSLKPASKAIRFLALGEDNYFNHLFKPLALVKAFPNPFHQTININYRIPFGIREVKFLFYNLQGQLLWQGKANQNALPGEYIFSLNTATMQGTGSLAAGVYLIRMQAINAFGKTIYGGKQKVFLVR